MKIHQKSTKMQFNQKDLGQIFLNQTFLNVLIKTFPKRYDTCRGLFFRPRVPSGAVCKESANFTKIWKLQFLLHIGFGHAHSCKKCFCLQEPVFWYKNRSSLKLLSEKKLSHEKKLSYEKVTKSDGLWCCVGGNISSCIDNSSFILNTLGPLCLWQCL